MNTKNAALNYSSDRQIIEYLVEIVPYIMIPILFTNLVIKTV